MIGVGMTMNNERDLTQMPDNSRQHNNEQRMRQGVDSERETTMDKK
jgi:hypothetical protein